MNAIPAEILLEIGKIDKPTYRGMLAIPKFARAVTVGYRLDTMAAANYNYRCLLLQTLYMQGYCDSTYFHRIHRTDKIQKLTISHFKNPDKTAFFMLIQSTSTHYSYHTDVGSFYGSNNYYNDGEQCLFNRSDRIFKIDKRGAVYKYACD